MSFDTTNRINVYDDNSYWQYIHGALMLGAWCLFIPTGIIIARHKHVYNGRKFLGVDMWFHGHRFFQFLGIGTFVSSFTIAFLKMGKPAHRIGLAHYIIGIILMGLTGTQALSLLLKPANGHSLRWLWNKTHRAYGILTLATAWANIYIGIYCFHKQSSENYTRWILPAAGSMFLMLATDVFLCVFCKPIEQEANFIVL